MAATTATAHQTTENAAGAADRHQRPSATSGWKVGAINAGRSPLGGPERALDTLVAEGAGSGRLRATTSYLDIKDAELILVCLSGRGDKDLAEVLGLDDSPRP